MTLGRIPSIRASQCSASLGTVSTASALFKSRTMERLPSVPNHRAGTGLVVHDHALLPLDLQIFGNVHQLALGPNDVKHLQQHRSQELLRRDARATALDVGLIHPREQPIRFVPRNRSGRGGERHGQTYRVL